MLARGHAPSFLITLPCGDASPTAPCPLQDLTAALLSSSGGRPVPEPHVSLEAALAAGAALADEQQAVLDIRLSREYMKGLEDDILHAEERRERWKRQAELDAARRLAAAQAAEAVRARAAEETRARAAEARAAEAEARAAAGLPPVDLAAAEEEEEEVAAEPPAPATASGLPGMSPDELAAALRERRAVALDVRSAREWDWGRIKGAKHAPYVVTKGSSLTPETAANPGFLDAAHAALGAPAAGGDLCICLYGPGQDLDTEGSEALVSKEKFVSIAPNGTGSVDGEDIVAAAARALQRAGYAQLRELAGGYRAWDLRWVKGELVLLLLLPPLLVLLLLLPA